jgi:predicted glycoside hydrolase/deacetylase ChbG (UPF0249 family)
LVAFEERRKPMTDRDRWLVVNADDLGRSPGVNAGIFEAHRKGLVTSATMMVGFAAAADAARGLADHPELGVGLHVTLTGAVPTLPPARVPSLVGADGRFPARPEGLKDPDPREIRAEVEHQLARFEELAGRPPTHLDSHHHSHRHPVVREVLIEIARARALPVRSSSEEIRRRLRESGVPTTDRFVERFYGDDTTLDVLLDILRGVEPGSTELMCHPGRVDDELRSGSTYVFERERELAVLCDPTVRALATDLGLRLARFGDACAS